MSPSAKGTVPSTEPQYPSRLDQVIGHHLQRGQLSRQVATGACAHAYWIAGPARVGKTAVAAALAAELLSAEGWPGGFTAHPDLWLDDEAGPLGIDRIRGGEGERGPSLQHFLSLSSFAGGPKVAVVANADRLTLPAANSLLRLLEEPPSDSILVLTTSRPDSEHLPNTLRSRCQQLVVGPVAAAEIALWLGGRTGLSSPECEIAAAISEGRPGLALEMARDPGLEHRTEGLVRSWLDCPASGPGGWLELSRELAERGREREVAVAAVRTWAAFLRDCCCRAAGAEELVSLPSFAAAAEAWGTTLGLSGCLRRYDLAVDALARLAEGATARLVLDRLLLLSFGGHPPNPPIPAASADSGR